MKNRIKTFPEQIIMKLTNLSFIILSFIISILWISACEDDSVDNSDTIKITSYEKRGYFGVGFKTLTIGEGTESSLNVSIWYPAIIPTSVEENITYNITLKDPGWTSDIAPTVDGEALLDADMDNLNGPYPLAVFSHGFSMSPAWYSVLIEHYASYGFVVIAPDHTEYFNSTTYENSMWQALIDRPIHIKKVLDFAEILTAENGQMAGMIDMDHVAMLGHSYGGYTALSMAGAQYDLDAYHARCAALSEDDPFAYIFCGTIVPYEADMATRAGYESVPEGLWPSFEDSRIKAIIPMAGDAYLFDQLGLANITIPMMAMGGTADTGTPYEWGAKMAYDDVSSATKILVGFVDAEHMIFTTPCDHQSWINDYPFKSNFCSDPVWEKDQALDLIQFYSTAFLLYTLKADTGAYSVLLPNTVQNSNIEYVTTLE